VLLISSGFGARALAYGSFDGVCVTGYCPIAAGMLVIPRESDGGRTQEDRDTDINTDN
jgi:hypothetical protein